MDAGFKHSNGDYVISLDGDRQNDPQDIPRLIKKMKEDDLDVVCGWRKNRADKSGIKVLTTIGRFIRRIFIKDKIHDTGCTLRIYNKKAVELYTRIKTDYSSSDAAKDIEGKINQAKYATE